MPAGLKAFSGLLSVSPPWVLYCNRPADPTLQEDACISAAVQRSVREQDAMLDGLYVPRLSTSSSLSTLTELSSSSNGSIFEGPRGVIARVFSSISNATRRVFGSLGPVDAEAQAATPEIANPISQAQKKKPRRRQKKKKTPPVPVAEHSHQWKRLRAFISSQGNSKRAKRKDGRTRKALDRAIVVPFEMEDFKTSGELGFEPRVYTLKEVTALGVTVIPWDGR
jgi:hypothetical protein